MTPARLKIVLTLACVLMSGAARAASVKLVNTRGSVIEAELVKLEGENLSFTMAGRPYQITLDQLSSQSQELVRQNFASTPTPPTAKSSPAANSAAKGNWAAFFPSGLVDAKGNSVSVESVQGKMVCLYFGASWCGICNVVIDPLKSLRKVAGEHVEVVLVGRDKSESEHFKYMEKKEMPWPCIKWSDAMAKDDNESRRLSGKYQAWGLPTVVLLSPTGEVLDEEARFKIQWLPEAAIKYYKDYDYRERVKEYRDEAREKGEKVDAAKEKAYVDRIRAAHEKDVAMYERLLEKSKAAPAPLSDSPTWEDILMVFYKEERKRR